MKRKFTQILMLLTIAVSMGAIVTSCKDTNEDLYNELRNLIGDDVTPGQTLKTQIKNLENQLNELKATVALIQSCECDMDALNRTIQGLKDQIAALEANKADKSQIAALQTALDNLTTQYNTISGLLASYKTAQDLLEGRVAAIEAFLANLNTGGDCSCDLTEILTRLSAVEQELITTKATATQALTLATEAKTIADAAKAAADAAKAAADAAQAAADAAQATANQAVTDAAAAQATADAAKTLAETLEALVGEHGTKLADHEARISALEVQVTTMSTRLEEAYTNAADAKAKADANEARLNNLEPRVQAAENDIAGLKTDVQNIRTLAEEAKTLAQEAKLAVENCRAHCAAEIAAAKAELMGKLNEMQDEIDAVNDALAAVQQDINALQAANTVQDGRLDALEGRMDGAEGRLDNIESQLNNFVTKETYNAKVQEIENRLDAIEAQLANFVTKEEFNTKVDEINTTIGNVKTALEAADQALQDQIDDLKDSIDDLTDRVEDVEDAIDEITDKLEKIAETLKNMVTGIIIQGTDNPAFGSISLPTNMQTNMLIAYFGTAQNDVYFPTNRTGNYTNPADALTDKDMEMIGAGDDVLIDAGEYLVENEENNAGTLYVTINPNTVDFKGLQLSLENSQGKVSGVKLGAAKPSKKTLGFGWTRAASNGFYEIPAYVPADGISKVQKVDFNTEKIKDAVKEIINNRTNADFSAIAQDLYHVASSLNMDANAVKCEWTDGNNETHSVVSTYNLAATATKPLSFNSLKDINVVTVPGYERANALLDRLAKELKDNIHAVFTTVNGTDLVADIQAINIKKIEFKGLTDEQKADFKFTLDTDIQLDGLTYTFELTDEEVPIKFSTNVEVDLSDLTVTTPMIVVNTTITDGSGNSTLIVPLKTNNDSGVSSGAGTSHDGNVNYYHVDIPLDDLVITATANPTVMNLDGLKKTINFNVNETAQISLSKVIDFSGKTVHVNKVIPLEDLADTFADLLEDQLDPVNDMLDQVKKVVDDVNIQLDKMNEYETRINNKVDNYVEKVRDYLERANNKLAGLFNSINSRFQPVLLGGSEGVKILSQAKAYPTVIKNGTVTFVPTTWNYELAVPVCKKHVAVTNVWSSSNTAVTAQDGDGGLKLYLDAANSGEKMNTVLEGSSRNIELTGLISGYTYEIAYSALDFHGIISTKKFYITVVD